MHLTDCQDCKDNKNCSVYKFSANCMNGDVENVRLGLTKDDTFIKDINFGSILFAMFGTVKGLLLIKSSDDILSEQLEENEILIENYKTVYKLLMNDIRVVNLLISNKDVEYLTNNQSLWSK